MASEVLGVKLEATLSNTERVLINGVNGHTYTILSITFCEEAGAAETFDLYVDDDGGGTDYYIYKAQPLGANQTFEWPVGSGDMFTTNYDYEVAPGTYGPTINQGG